MCGPGAIGAAMLGGTALQAYGQYQQGTAADQAARATAANMEQQGREQEVVDEMARNIKRNEGAQALSQGREAFAQRNVALGGNAPSTANIWEIGARQELAADVEALQMTSNSQRRSLLYGASITRAQGANARTAARLQAAGTLMSGASQGAYMMGGA